MDSTTHSDSSSPLTCIIRSERQQQQQQEQQQTQESKPTTPRARYFFTTTTRKAVHCDHNQTSPKMTLHTTARATTATTATTTTTTTATRTTQCNSRTHTRPAARRQVASCLAMVTLAVMLAITHHGGAEAASANRVPMHQMSRQKNQYFLNEFCDLESKALRSAEKLRHDSTTSSVILSPRQTHSSVRVVPQKSRIPSSISFGLGSSSSASQASAQPPVLKQLNCSIIVVAPQSHGLLVRVNSAGFPKNLTKLGITLNHDSPHAQHIQLGGENSSADYLLTQPQSSKIAINLQSFKPIDWSHVSFDILFTVYKKANSTGCPTRKWFDCGDNICVPSSLVCDNNRNCPNGNDEMIFYACYSPLFWSIAASCGLALVLIAIMGVVIMVVRNQRRRRGLTKLNSFSNQDDELAGADADHYEQHNHSSKLDLTQAEQLANSRGLTLGGQLAGSGSYLASNMYLGGFENPVWTNGTLPKGATTAVASQTTQTQNPANTTPSAPSSSSQQ